MNINELKQINDDLIFTLESIKKESERLKPLGDLPQNIEKLAQVFGGAPKQLEELNQTLLETEENMWNAVSRLKNETDVLEKAKFAPASLIAYAAASLAAIAMFAAAFYFFQSAKEYQNTTADLVSNSVILTDLAAKNIKFNDVKTAKTKDGKSVVVLSANTQIELLDAQTIILYEKK